MASQKHSLLIIIDGIDFFDDDTAADWLPSSILSLKGIHWLLSSSKERQFKGLIERKGFQRIDVDELVEDQQEGLLLSIIKRHKPEVFREHLEAIKAAELGRRPDFLMSAMDLMRMSRDAEQSHAIARWASEFHDMGHMYVEILKKWCTDVKGLRDMLCYLSLSETGLYEHELMQLLQVSKPHNGCCDAISPCTCI